MDFIAKILTLVLILLRKLVASLLLVIGLGVIVPLVVIFCTLVGAVINKAKFFKRIVATTEIEQ